MHPQTTPIYPADITKIRADIQRLAEDVFESNEFSLIWLHQSHPMLDGESPLQAGETSFGAQKVRDILIAIKYGGVV